jgi:hypothetical protein
MKQASLSSTDQDGGKWRGMEDHLILSSNAGISSLLFLCKSPPMTRTIFVFACGIVGGGSVRGDP